MNTRRAWEHGVSVPSRDPAPTAGPAAGPEPIAILDEIERLVSELRGALDLSGAEPRRARADTMLRCAPIALDVARMRVTFNDRPVLLTPRELLLLRYFLEHPGEVLTRERLLIDVWDYRYTGDARTVDVHVCRLRRKLPALNTFLRTLKRVGYVLTRPEPEPSRSTVAHDAVLQRSATETAGCAPAPGSSKTRTPGRATRRR